MKKVLFGLGIMALASSLYAQPAVVLVDVGPVAGSDDAAAAHAALQVIPPPSSTDLVNGNAGFEIDPRLTHGGTTLDLAALTNGASGVTYPNQLPGDDPGAGVPVSKIGYDLGGATDVGSVVVYAYNWNGGTPDIRNIPPFAVFTTTDATVDENSNWTEILPYSPPNGVAPAGLEWFTGSAVPSDWGPYLLAGEGHGGAICVADESGALLASGITGIRVDIYCAGFGDTLRDAENVGAGVEAVASPFLSEIDVLTLTDTVAFFDPNSSVGDWSFYD